MVVQSVEKMLVEEVRCEGLRLFMSLLAIVCVIGVFCFIQYVIKDNKKHKK
jgi:hypothetical protein